MRKNRVFLAICIAAFTILNAPVFAQTEADFTVALTDDGAGVRITRYTGTAKAVRIPATIQGMPVKEIGDNDPSNVIGGSDGPFEDSGITSVVIPDGVAYIGVKAFFSCRNLAQVTIPDSVTLICDKAFYNCAALRTITLPDSVTTLGSDAGMVFAHSGLTSITLPKGLTSIESLTFEDCERLASVVIPEGVSIIGYSAFEGCSALVSVSLPAAIEWIGSQAFMGCASLTTVAIPDSVGEIDNIERDAFMFCSKLTLASQAALKRRGFTGSFGGY